MYHGNGGGGRKEGDGVNMIEVHFICVCMKENSIMKPLKLFKRGKEEKGVKKKQKGVNLIKAHLYACMKISQ
jgi:hypothetical protein